MCVKAGGAPGCAVGVARWVVGCWLGLLLGVRLSNRDEERVGRSGVAEGVSAACCSAVVVNPESHVVAGAKFSVIIAYGVCSGPARMYLKCLMSNSCEKPLGLECVASLCFDETMVMNLFGGVIRQNKGKTCFTFLGEVTFSTISFTVTNSIDKCYNFSKHMHNVTNIDAECYNFCKLIHDVTNTDTECYIFPKSVQNVTIL